MVHNNNIYLYRTNSTIQFSNAFICRGHSSLGEGGGIRIKMEHPFHRYFSEIMIDIKHNVITNKSNWQEANLLEELNLARGRGGG